MGITPILAAERIEAMTRLHYWRNRLLTEFLDQHATTSPNAIAVVDPAFNRRISYQVLREESDRIATNLLALGIEAGDVVSIQLPNWWHLHALHLACLRIGAISNLMMPGLRERELSFVLSRARSKVLVVPQRFRNFDYVPMYQELRQNLPLLKHVVVVGLGQESAGNLDFDTALIKPACGKPPRHPLSPNQVIQLLFTSGTTGQPKGVLHISNTVLSHSIAVSERMRLSAADTILTATPVTHQTGFLYGLQMPIVLGAKSVLQESWNPKQALQLIDAEKVTFSMGATPFLSDLANHPDAHLAKGRLKIFMSGGAPIPPALARRANETLGAKVIAMWGMTENGAVTTTMPDDSDEKIYGTDGCPMPGMEIRVEDAQGKELPRGEVGFLKCRGPNNFVGYLNQPDLYSVDAQQWFDTGDLARIDDDGYVRITGRAKDMIIRGGENVPVVEVEGVLLRHPSIERIAIVAMPDARLGERACAFVVVKPDQHFDIKELRRYLEDQKMMRNYWPERVECIDRMPTTESGKIQKMKLREIAKDFTA